jgi:NAD(P)-dependent dehydrogenase (short-subunit alcohol dehydrogenase family)
VTGGASGIGSKLVKILYQKNAIIYIAGRSLQNADKAREKILSEFPESTGKVECLLLDLADLSAIKNSANKYMLKEQRLDVLWNKDAVGQPPEGSKSAQVCRRRDTGKAAKFWEWCVEQCKPFM